MGRVLAYASIAIASVAAAGPAPQADPPSGTPQEEPMEGLPPHLAVAVERNDAALAAPIADVDQSVVEDITLWDMSKGALKVCFMDGDILLKRKIMTAAQEWQRPGSSVRFDFGSPANPRSCDGTSFNHIRIGFRYKGYWSLVGQHNVASAKQYEQSMNFEGWDVRDVDDAVLHRIVLHEFGHAIGFRHELQNPFSTCETQFDWPFVYEDMKKKPNEWDKPEVDRQMRRLMTGTVSASAFDRDSIMIYPLKAQYFKNGDKSPCFQTERNALSAGDISTVKAKYPANVAAQLALRNQAFNNYDILLKGGNIAVSDLSRATAALQPFSPNIGLATKSLQMDHFQQTAGFQ